MFKRKKPAKQSSLASIGGGERQWSPTPLVLSPYLIAFSGILIVVWGLTLLLISNSPSTVIILPLLEIIHGSGDPQRWINSSVKYREQIASVYYFVLLAVPVMFCIGLTKSRLTGIGKRTEETSFAQKLFALVLFGGVFLYFIYGFGANQIVYADVVPKDRYAKFFLNTLPGVLLLEYMVLYLAAHLGVVIGATWRALVKIFWPAK